MQGEPFLDELDATRQRATDGEIEVRRQQVLRLRLARFSEPEIGARLGVSPATVSRDLAEIQKTWGERFQNQFDVLRELAETVALYELLEGAAVRELIRLEADPKAGTTSKVKAIVAAGNNRKIRTDLLVSAGLLVALPPPSSHNLPTAAEIQAALAQIEIINGEVRERNPIVA